MAINRLYDAVNLPMLISTTQYFIYDVLRGVQAVLVLPFCSEVVEAAHRGGDEHIKFSFISSVKHYWLSHQFINITGCYLFCINCIFVIKMTNKFLLLVLSRINKLAESVFPADRHLTWEPWTPLPPLLTTSPVDWWCAMLPGAFHSSDTCCSSADYIHSLAYSIYEL